MGFRCANCGGNILFDVDSQSMKCQHCGTMISPDEFEVKNSSTGENVPGEYFSGSGQAGDGISGSAEPSETGSGAGHAGSMLTLFTCSSCGAELQGTEDSQVGFCPYCGGQSLLKAPGGSRAMPERLIPFQVSKDRCRELFQNHTKKVRYLPKILRDASHLQNFTGIYMPYYEYDVEMGASSIVGTKVVESTPRYDKINTYRIDASVNGQYCGVPYDASQYYDDEIAARVLPFDMKKERPFRAAYLSGFYADASSVPAETYYRDAEETASDDIVAEVARKVKMQDGITVEKNSSHVEAHTRSHHSTMFPLWFLTWRKNNRVVYAVVNGESGKVVSDLPVDMRSFSLGCAAFAVILFLILELLFQPTPLITSMVSLVAGILMAASINSSTKRIFEKETHANDKGWTAGKDPKIAKEGSATRKRYPTVAEWLRKHLTSFLFVLAISISVLINGSAVNLPIVSVFIALGAVLYLFITVRKILGWQKSMPQRRPLAAILLVAAAVIINAAIVFISPVNDAWYYMGDAACILILIIAAAIMLQVYNISTTRPLPRLFDRKEVQ